VGKYASYSYEVCKDSYYHRKQREKCLIGYIAGRDNLLIPFDPSQAKRRERNHEVIHYQGCS
jgi:hypothetical protein